MAKPQCRIPMVQPWCMVTISSLVFQEQLQPPICRSSISACAFCPCWFAPWSLDSRCPPSTALEGSECCFSMDSSPLSPFWWTSWRKLHVFLHNQPSTAALWMLRMHCSWVWRIRAPLCLPERANMGVRGEGNCRREKKGVL